MRLPVDRVRDGIARLVPQLAATDEGLAAVARAIMTTDTKIKLATTSVELPGPDGAPVRVTVSGLAKGVGMIHPRMATMLGVILTVLTCITLFFVHVIRGEQAQIESDNNPPPPNPPKV